MFVSATTLPARYAFGDLFVTKSLRGVLGKIQGAISHVNGHKPQTIPLYIIQCFLMSTESLWLLHALALTALTWNSPMRRQENLRHIW